MTPNTFLSGERVYLRGLDEHDVKGNYVHWLNDPEVCRYNSHHTFPYTQEQALAYIRSLSNTRDKLVLAIIERQSQKHIGNLALQNIHAINQSAEFAILMGEKAFWGLGYGKEAASLIMTHGFLALNLHRIYCGTNHENIGMQKLAESLGMKEEGRLRQATFKHGKFMDVIQYGILKSEYFDHNKE
ncbi:MAG: GNAT family N-acetyltransferase [Cyanobacteria bacterium]|nr:GNAT family N-acetyltransferase [Cyanobacteriota bacterium]